MWNPWLIVFFIIVIAVWYAYRALITFYYQLPVDKRTTICTVRLWKMPVAVLPIGLAEYFFPNNIEQIICVFTDKIAAHNEQLCVFSRGDDVRVAIRITVASGERHSDTIERYVKLRGSCTAMLIKAGCPTYYLCRVGKAMNISLIDSSRCTGLIFIGDLPQLACGNSNGNCEGLMPNGLLSLITALSAAAGKSNVRVKQTTKL